MDNRTNDIIPGLLDFQELKTLTPKITRTNPVLGLLGEMVDPPPLNVGADLDREAAYAAQDRMNLLSRIPTWAQKKSKKGVMHGPLADATLEEIEGVARRLSDDFEGKYRGERETELTETLKEVRYDKLEPIQRQKDVYQELHNIGAEHFGPGYFRLPNGLTVRVSDHYPTNARSMADVFITYNEMGPHPVVHKRARADDENHALRDDSFYTKGMTPKDVLNKIIKEYQHDPDRDASRQKAEARSLYYAPKDFVRTIR